MKTIPTIKTEEFNTWWRTEGALLHPANQYKSDESILDSLKEMSWSAYQSLGKKEIEDLEEEARQLAEDLAYVQYELIKKSEKNAALICSIKIALTELNKIELAIDK